MTEAFCTKERVTVVSMDLFFNWDDKDLSNALYELGIAEIFAKTGKMVSTTPYIELVNSCDLVVDFSGEMWGYHADLVGRDRFLVGLIKDRIPQLLGISTVMLAGSQGRFPDSQIKEFAKEVFKNFQLIANREAETRKLLIEDGFDVSNLKDFACPSFLFEPKPDDEMQNIFEKERLNNSEGKKVGLVICGFNMLTEPYDKWPRENSEYNNFVDLVEYLIGQLDLSVYLMSHSNGFQLPPNFKLITGRDFPLAKQLYEIVMRRNKVNIEKLYLIEGPYNPWETKAIIKQFDMFVAGRLHASVAAISQSVPTVVIMHGHKQKSHKTIGFYDIVGLPECVAYPHTAANLIDRVNYCWENRTEIRKHLDKRIPEVKQLARNSFDALVDVVKKNGK